MPADNLRQAGLDPEVYVPAEPRPPAQFLAGLGAGHTWGQDVAPPFGAGIEAWRVSGRTGARPAFGLSGDWGLGPVPPLGGLFPVATVRVSGGLWWGQRWLWGPMLGGGALWRRPPRGSQLGPFLAPGMRVQRSLGPWFVGIEGEVIVLPTDEGSRAMPGVGLSLGRGFGKGG